MRKFKLYNKDKTQSYDLNNENHFAINPKGLGLEYDITFSSDGTYVDKFKEANQKINFTMIFGRNPYHYYDELKKFIYNNAKNKFILEYLIETYKTTQEIALKDEILDVEVGDDEYFVRVQDVVSKYDLKPETVPFVETSVVPEITLNKYAEVKLLEGKTVDLLSVLNPKIKVGINTLTPSEQLIANYYISPTLKNSEINDNGQKRIDVQVDEVTYNGTENWLIETSGTDNLTIMFYINGLFNSVYSPTNAKSNIFPHKYVYGLEEEGFFSSTARLRVKILRSKLTTQDSTGFKTWLQEQSTLGNPFTVTYELAVKNPKTKVIEDGDVTNDGTNYYIVYPTDYKISGTSSIGGVMLTDNGTSLVYPMTNTNPVGKTLTYELATPRLADVTFEGTEAQFFDTFRSNGTTKDELTIINGEYKKIERIDVNGNIITPIIKDITIDGGLELIPNSYVFVSDDNNLLTSVLLQYKLWNKSNIITETNLGKYTVTGDDLIVYLKHDELLGDELLETKIANYFEYKYVNILLDSFVKTDNNKYRDVYVQRLGKEEKDNFGALRCEFEMTGIDSWYRNFMVADYGDGQGFMTGYPLGLANFIDKPLKISILSDVERQGLKLSLLSGSNLISSFELPITIEANKEYIIDAITKTYTGFTYGQQDMTKSSFIIVPPFMDDTWYLKVTDSVDSAYNTNARIEYRELV